MTGIVPLQISAALPAGAVVFHGGCGGGEDGEEETKAVEEGGREDLEVGGGHFRPPFTGSAGQPQGPGLL